MKKIVLIALLLCFVSVFGWGEVMAVTPIARYDVVPHQRIESTDTFNFGVVAFSKAGIEKVVFTISGQSYGGTGTECCRNNES
jgi:hypothetical protein